MSREEADHFFWTQVLTGDATDNIPGCPGIGPVKARLALAKARTNADRWLVARAHYLKSYGEIFSDDALLENGQLLWIRRAEGQVWSPEWMVWMDQL